MYINIVLEMSYFRYLIFIFLRLESYAVRKKTLTLTYIL